MRELKDTTELMQSKDYKERFIAEYWQLKIRYEKLKDFCNKIEASTIIYNLQEPQHDVPLYVLRKQQSQMGELLHTLEVRAIIEKIDLQQDIKSNDAVFVDKK